MFVAFMEAYYEWLSQSVDRQILANRDVDLATDQFLDQFKATYLPNITYDSVTNKRLLIKNAMDLYRSKGTTRGIDLFMRLIYGVGAEVVFPGDRVLRASDAKWIQPRFIEVSKSPRTKTLIDTMITGASSGATAFVESVVERRTANDRIDVLIISDVNGEFIVGEALRSGRVYNNSPRIVGSVLKGTVINGGVNFKKYQDLTFKSLRGDYGVARVTGVTKDGTITKLKIMESGIGFQNDETVYLQLDGVTGASMKVNLYPVGRLLGYSDGFGLENQHIHDGDYWQEFSYDVLTSIPFDKYRTTMLDVLHAAGRKLFGSTVFKSIANFFTGKGTSSVKKNPPTSNVISAPSNTVAPTLNGTASQGNTLTVTNGAWSNNPTSFTYQWQRGITNIAGATASAYRLVSADVGVTVRCVVTAHNRAGNGFAPSNSTSTVAISPPANLPSYPTISGSPVVGETLTASNGSWSGSPSEYRYQWRRGSTNISGATNQTYIVDGGDVGSIITVVVTAVNAGGDGVATSAGVGPVGGTTAPAAFISDPAITGTLVEGSTLSVSNGTFSGIPTPTVASRQWLRNGIAIANATNPTYMLVTTDVGKTISCDVTITNSSGSATRRGTASGTVSALTAAPQFTSDPVLSGNAIVGATLTTSNGVFTGTPTPTVISRQWYRNGSLISGATNQTYILVSGDAGATITCRVTIQNSAGSATGVSSSKGPITSATVAPSFSVNPTISGTLIEGETLTASPGTYTGNPIPTISGYQWYRTGAPISGATNSTYMLIAADVNTTIRVQVTVQNSEGFADATSAATGLIAPISAGAPSLPAPVLSLISSNVDGSSPKLEIRIQTGPYAVGDTVRIYRRDKAGALIQTYTNTIDQTEAQDNSLGFSGRADFGLSTIPAGTWRYTADVVKAGTGEYSFLSPTLIVGPDDSAPVITEIQPSATSSTSGKVTFVTNEPGQAKGLVTLTNTPPTQSQMNTSSSIISAVTGLNEIVFSGLTPNTPYYVWLQQTDLAVIPNTSEIIVGGSFTSIAAGTSYAKLFQGAPGVNRNQYVTVDDTGYVATLNNNPGAASLVRGTTPISVDKFHAEWIPSGFNGRFYIGFVDTSTAIGPLLYKTPGKDTPGLSFGFGGTIHFLGFDSDTPGYATNKDYQPGDVFAFDVDKTNNSAVVFTVRHKRGDTITTLFSNVTASSNLPPEDQWTICSGADNSPQSLSINVGQLPWAIPPLTDHIGITV